MFDLKWISIHFASVWDSGVIAAGYCAIFPSLTCCCKSLRVNKVSERWNRNRWSIEWALEHKNGGITFKLQGKTLSVHRMKSDAREAALVRRCHTLGQINKNNTLGSKYKGIDIRLHQYVFSLCPKTGCCGQNIYILIKENPSPWRDANRKVCRM